MGSALIAAMRCCPLIEKAFVDSCDATLRRAPGRFAVGVISFGYNVFRSAKQPIGILLVFIPLLDCLSRLLKHQSP